MIDLELPVLDFQILENTTKKPKMFSPRNAPRSLYVETYGCQMNTSDSEIVQGIMSKSGYVIADKPDNADVILLNTCSIRDNAERKIYERLEHLKFYKKRNRNLIVGILGCMAERLRTELIEEKKLVDLIIGPDEYRKVPQLVENAYYGEKGIAVKLSRVETYDDIIPLRTEGNSAWVSVTRGCDKFCTYCVVPFTRGRERSRSLESIVDEAKYLWDSGFREITLLGQNVNSFFDEALKADFADLLSATAQAVPKMRIRYSTSHPEDMSNKLIETMAEFSNICKYVHLPFQSGSNRVLELMNRTYTAEHYLERIEKIKSLMPNCALSTDIIAGFPTETDKDHEATLDLMRKVRYDGAYMFKYSPREGTKSFKMGDDIPDEVKTSRLNDIIDLQQKMSYEKNQATIGNIESVLVEGASKRNPADWNGRTDSNKVVIFPHDENANYIVGDIILAKINRATSGTLFGELVCS